LHAVLELGVELGCQLLVFIVKWPDSVCKDPVIPSVLPALVMNSVAKAVAWLFAWLHVHDFRLVEHVHVKAENLFVLVELGRLLLTRGSHDGQKVLLSRRNVKEIFDSAPLLADGSRDDAAAAG
jgi:hypothetical protein